MRLDEPRTTAGKHNIFTARSELPRERFSLFGRESAVVSVVYSTVREKEALNDVTWFFDSAPSSRARHSAPAQVLCRGAVTARLQQQCRRLSECILCQSDHSAAVSQAAQQ